MTGRDTGSTVRVPAIGSIVDVPALHPRSFHRREEATHWMDGQRGRVVELMSDNPRRPDDPSVCLEFEEDGKPVFGWFSASDIQAGAVAEMRFCLSVDCMLSEHPPYRSARPNEEGLVMYFFPETNEWMLDEIYDGPTG